MSLPFLYIYIIDGLSITSLFGIVYIIFSIIDINNLKIYNKAIILVSVLFFLYNIFSCIISIDITMSISKMIALMYNLIILLFSLLRVYTNKEFAFLIKSVIVSSWFLIILCILFGARIEDNRFALMFGEHEYDPNYLCISLVFPILYYIDKIFSVKFKFKYIINIFVFLFVVFLTGSRGGLLSVIGAIIYYLIITKKLSVKNIIVISCFAFIVIGCLVPIIEIDVINRLSVSQMVADGGSGRLTIWRSILNGVYTGDLNNQIFGHGIGTSNIVNVFSNHAAHNMWIDSISDLGLIGFCVTFCFYFGFFVKSNKVKVMYLPSIFVGCMISGMFLSIDVNRVVIIIFVLIGVCANIKSIDAVQNEVIENV